MMSTALAHTLSGRTAVMSTALAHTLSGRTAVMSTALEHTLSGGDFCEKGKKTGLPKSTGSVKYVNNWDGGGKKKGGGGGSEGKRREWCVCVCLKRRQ